MLWWNCCSSLCTSIPFTNTGSTNVRLHGPCDLLPLLLDATYIYLSIYLSTYLYLPYLFVNAAILTAVAKFEQLTVRYVVDIYTPTWHSVTTTSSPEKIPARESSGLTVMLTVAKSKYCPDRVLSDVCKVGQELAVLAMCLSKGYANAQWFWLLPFKCPSSSEVIGRLMTWLESAIVCWSILQK